MTALNTLVVKNEDEIKNASDVTVITPTGVVLGTISLKNGFTKRPNPPKWPYIMSMAELFNQTEIWIDKHGNQFPIKRMTLDYVANTLRFIRDKRSWVAAATGVQPFFNSYTQHSDAGVAGLPLVKALRARLADAYSLTDTYRPNWDGTHPATYDEKFD